MDFIKNKFPIIGGILAGLIFAFFCLQVVEISNELDRQAKLIQQIEKQERYCLIEALWHEARGETKEGIIAVASVIENRKNHPDYPKTYCGVTQQYKQFSYTMMNKPNAIQIEDGLKLSEYKAYQLVSTIAENMIKGNFKPSLKPSVLWYTTKTISNRWTKKKMIVTEIGKHRFYRNFGG